MGAPRAHAEGAYSTAHGTIDAALLNPALCGCVQEGREGRPGQRGQAGWMNRAEAAWAATLYKGG